jgi:glucose dehydrogenase
MQSNPIVVDGVLYATTPTLKGVVLDAGDAGRLGEQVIHLERYLHRTRSSSTSSCDLCARLRYRPPHGI